jgi:hypothetical protein
MNNLSKLLFPLVAISAALYVMVSILTSGGSSLSESMIYLAVFGVIIGLMNGKMGMVFLFIIGNYLDVVKRLLVVEGAFEWNDIIRILAVAPITMSAIFLGVLLKLLRTENPQFPWKRLILASVIFIIVASSALLGGDNFRNTAQTIANSSLYAGLIAFAGVIYKHADEQRKLFALLIGLYLPVLFYAWAQLIGGYSAIEVEYARSGFTVSTQPLLHPSDVEYKRIFSTMNSSNAYSIVGSILSIYALLFGIRKGFLGRIAGLLFALACFGSQIPGAGRTSWAMIVITIGAYFVFRSGKLTIAAYLFTLSATVLFLFNAEIVGEWLVINSQAIMGDSDFAQRATTMGTFTARTIGITEWMTKREYFSWFGLPRSEAAASGAHDMVGQIYVSSGVVGLSIAVAFGGVVLYQLHRGLLSITNSDSKRLASFYMANIFAILVGGIFSGSALHIFPINVYFWLMIGFLFQLVQVQNSTRASNLKFSTADGDGETTGPPMGQALKAAR